MLTLSLTSVEIRRLLEVMDVARVALTEPDLLAATLAKYPEAEKARLLVDLAGVCFSLGNALTAAVSTPTASA